MKAMCGNMPGVRHTLLKFLSVFFKRNIELQIFNVIDSN